MKKWQYLRMCSWRDDNAMLEELTEKGKLGWELVAVVVTNSGLNWIFKRPYEDSVDADGGDTVRFGTSADDGQTRRMDR